MKFKNILKNIFRIYGFKNAPTDGIPGPAIVSRVNRRRPPSLYMYFLLPVYIIILMAVFAVVLTYAAGPRLPLAVMFTVFALLIFVSLFIHRYTEGDTVVLSPEGLWEVNWISRKLIRWEDLHYIRIFERWKVIRVKGNGGRISIHGSYSDFPAIAKELKNRCPERVEVIRSFLRLPFFTALAVIALTP